MAFFLCGITVAEASLTYSNPFHPEQCEIAVAVGERALAGAPEDARAREILAEGLLCRGLEQDDPWALASALDTLQARRASHPDDFFAQMYVAAALQRRFPLSDEAIVAIHDAQAALPTADVGAARESLSAYLRDAVAALNAHRAQFLPLLHEREAALRQGPLAPAQLVELLTLLPQTGAAGLDQARAILDARLTQHPNVALDTFYRAEILRGRESPKALMPLYRAAIATLCDAPGAQPFNECQRARWRLEQLEAVAGNQDGG